MDYVFEGWYGKRIDLSDFNTNNVKSMVGLFCNDGNRSNIEEIIIKGIDTSNVKDMSYMFDGCWNLKEVNLASFNTSNV